MTGRPAATQTSEQWRVVDEGWGRKAADFATLSEPTNCREYVAVHHRLGVGAGDRLLDLACGSGLAVELATLRGASCAGIDASPRLLAVARDRNPDADLQVGDMNALPWMTKRSTSLLASRDLGNDPEAVAEAFRVLVPGSRWEITVWGHIKASPGAWVFAPFTLASEAKVRNQAAMVALGRPEAGEALLVQAGFTDVERIEVPFVFEFSDPETYAPHCLHRTGIRGDPGGGRAVIPGIRGGMRSETGPEGLPLRTPIALVGYLAVKPVRQHPRDQESSSHGASTAMAGFLAAPPDTPEARRLEDNLEDVGYVMNVSRLWARLPSALQALSDLMGETTRAAALTFRQRAVLVTSAAAALGDSYCSLAWGKKLAEATSPELAAAVIGGEAEAANGLEEDEKAFADWARRIARDPQCHHQR